MISINATLVLQVIQFLILVFIMNRLMLKPILKLTNERSEHIEKKKKEIKNIEEETERLRQEYFSIQEKARKEAVKERSKLRNLGLTEMERVVNDSRTEMASIRAQADDKADKEIAKVRPSVLEEARAVADEIIEVVIGRRIEG